MFGFKKNSISEALRVGPWLLVAIRVFPKPRQPQPHEDSTDTHQQMIEMSFTDVSSIFAASSSSVKYSNKQDVDMVIISRPFRFPPKNWFIGVRAYGSCDHGQKTRLTVLLVGGPEIYYAQHSGTIAFGQEARRCGKVSAYGRSAQYEHWQQLRAFAIAKPSQETMFLRQKKTKELTRVVLAGRRKLVLLSIPSMTLVRSPHPKIEADASWNIVIRGIPFSRQSIFWHTSQLSIYHFVFL